MSFGGILSSAGGLFGAAASIYGTAKQVQSQREVNKMNLQIAREQMGFQERMSGTSMQRRMSDLAKAGLNPVLAGLSQGASTPPGQSAVMQNPYANLNIGQKVSSALGAMKFKKELSILEGQRALLKAQTDKAQTEKEEVSTRVGVARLPVPHKLGRFLQREYPGIKFTNMADAMNLVTMQLGLANIDNTSAQTMLHGADLPARRLTGSIAGGAGKLGSSLAPLLWMLPAMRAGRAGSMSAVGIRKLLRGLRGNIGPKAGAIFRTGYSSLRRFKR